MGAFRVSICAMMLLLSTAYGDQRNTRGGLQTTCTIPVPTAIQNRLRSQFRSFELQTAQNLSPAAKARWKWEGAVCPGLVAGHFEGRGIHLWAALLVPRDSKAQGYRFVVFRSGASNADLKEAVLDQADDGDPHDLFIKSVQANQVFDESSRVKFGIHAEQALAFFDVGKQEYEVDVYYWARGHYQHTPIDY